MATIKNIALPQKEIADFCRRWQINECALFGSVLRDDFGLDSDLDVLVTFAPQADWSLFDHGRMEEALSQWQIRFKTAAHTRKQPLQPDHSPATWNADCGLLRAKKALS